MATKEGLISAVFQYNVTDPHCSGKSFSNNDLIDDTFNSLSASKVSNSYTCLKFHAPQKKKLRNGSHVTQQTTWTNIMGEFSFFFRSFKKAATSVAIAAAAPMFPRLLLLNSSLLRLLLPTTANHYYTADGRSDLLSTGRPMSS